MAEQRSPGAWGKSPEEYYDSPPPVITFKGSKFVLTGVFALGEHADIGKQIENVGGSVTRTPPKTGCYVVVGTLPTREWVTSDAGRKLLTALELRQEGNPVCIVGEDTFVTALLAVQNDPTQSVAPKKEVGFPWEETLAAWLAPLTAEGLVYEYSMSKAMVAVHLPGKPKERLCTIRFSPYGPTSIDVPRIMSDQLPICWENGDHSFDAVVEKRLSLDVIQALREKFNQLAH